MIGREFAHVHGESDGSLHIRLTEADARTLIETGWGELHLMAGIRGFPLGLVMVYAPRTIIEIQVILKILTASYDFAIGKPALKYTE
jgi:phospholipase/carboxylesterase